jgi:transmembrane sensor
VIKKNYLQSGGGKIKSIVFTVGTMKEISKKYDDLLDGYISGKLNKKDELELSEWLSCRPDSKSLLELAKSRNTLNLISSESPDKSWSQISARLDNNNFSINVIGRVLKYAAIFLLIFGGGLASYHFYSDKDLPGHVYSTVEIPFGERGKVVLPDSTVIVMNSGSRLKYSSAYSISNRDIEFEGEGYFDVSSSIKPFIIISNEVRINVLGTRFNFMSYPEDSLVETTLYEGELYIGHKTDGYSSERKVYPGQRVVLNKEDLKLTAFNILPGTEGPGWVFNHMTFENLSFEEITRQLERKFNFNIDLNNEDARSLRYTGRFVNDEDLDEILHIIEKASPIDLSVSKSERKRHISIK